MGELKFKYHPNIHSDGILVHKEGICQCCGRLVKTYVKNSIYCLRWLNCICLSCVHSGRASAKYNARFVQDAEPVYDLKKKNELFFRTPGYVSWQGTYWLSCCDDYCEYHGTIGIEELENMGIKDEVLKDYEVRYNKYSIEVIEKHLRKNGNLRGYLFRCIHCEKYRIYIDAI